MTAIAPFEASTVFGREGDRGSAVGLLVHREGRLTGTSRPPSKSLTPRASHVVAIAGRDGTTRRSTACERVDTPCVTGSRRRIAYRSRSCDRSHMGRTCDERRGTRWQPAVAIKASTSARGRIPSRRRHAVPER